MRSLQAVHSAYEFSPDDAPLVAAICHRLDGLPLAIELAAARGALFSPCELLRRLDDRLALLHGGARDLPERQQTLRATIGWSYDLLDPDEQRVFARLSVFAGIFSLDAALAVGGTHAELHIEALLQHSLLQRHEGVDGEPRVAMLQLVRDFARERLVASGEEPEIRHRHARYFLARAEQAEPALFSTEQGVWLRRLADEHDDLRAVVLWASAADAADAQTIALRLTAALWFFWGLRGGYAEGRHLFDAALAGGRASLDRVDADGDTAVANQLRAALACTLINAGMLAEFSGDISRAATLLHEALAIHRALGDGDGDGEGAALAQLYLGRTLRHQGDYARAEQLAQQSLLTLRQGASRDGVLWALCSLGDIALDQGDFGRASAYFNETLAIGYAQGDADSIATSLMNLGRIAYYQGDYEAARACYDEGLALTAGARIVSTKAELLLCNACLAQTVGDNERAAAGYRRSLRLFQQIDGRQFIAPCLEGLAGVLAAAGDPLQAAGLFGAAAALREAIGFPLRPVAQGNYKHDTAATCAVLAPHRWEAAYTNGRSLSVNAAVLTALAEQEPRNEASAAPLHISLPPS